MHFRGEPSELLPLGGRQPCATVGAIRLRLLHPEAQGRRYHVRLAGDRIEALAFVEDEAGRPAA
jgi:hypothetical protein